MKQGVKIVSVLCVCAGLFLAGCSENSENVQGTSDAPAAIVFPEESETKITEVTTTKTDDENEKADGEEKSETTTAVTTTITVVTTTEPAPEWTETEIQPCVMYVNTNWICSRVKAIIGSTKVNFYKINDAVTVVAITDTDYCKLDDGYFIHSDYLSDEKIVVTTTTTAAPTEAPVQQPPQNSGKYISSGYNELDDVIEPILDSIITDGMTDVQKLRAVYDYVMQFSYFERTLLIPDSLSGYREQLYALQLLNKGYGVCYDFAGAFKYLTRALGFDTQMIYGWHTNPSGGAGDHCWNQLYIGGIPYIFDAGIEKVMMKQGYHDSRFMRTYGEIGHFYIW